jgi:hypothetical protein
MGENIRGSRLKFLLHCQAKIPQAPGKAIRGLKE